MSKVGRFVGLVALAVPALGQLQTVDPGTGALLAFAIPDVDAAPFDIIVSVSAPAGAGWVGVAWGGAMRNAPLSVAWPYGDSVVAAPRWTESYSLPKPYDGASIFVFPTSEASSDGWTATYLCEGCSQWEGGSLDPNGEVRLASVMGSQPVAEPGNLETAFSVHNAPGLFGFDLSTAKLSAADWEALVSSLSGDVAVGDPGEVVDPEPEDPEEQPEEPEEGSGEDPVEPPAAEPTEEPVEPPAAEPTEEPVEPPAAEPTEEHTEPPAAEPTEEHTEPPAAEPTTVPEPPVEEEQPVEEVDPPVEDPGQSEPEPPTPSEVPEQTEPDGPITITIPYPSEDDPTIITLPPGQHQTQVPDPVFEIIPSP